MPRAPPQPSSGLGIEDEMSFGSDEDLLEDVGEIPLPNIVPPLPSAPSIQARHPPTARVEKPKSGRFSSGFKSLGSSKKDKDKDDSRRKRTTTEETVKLSQPSFNSIYPASASRSKKDSKQLAKSSLVIEPQLESVLDLAAMGSPSAYSGSGSASGSTPSLGSVPTPAGSASKKKGLMGAFRGLGIGSGAKKEEPVNVFGGAGGGGGARRVDDIRRDNGLYPVKSIDSFGTKSDYSRQQSIDIPSTFSSPRTESSNQSSHQHHLAPISMSPFQPLPPDLTPDSTVRSSIASHQSSLSSLQRRTSVAASIATGNDIGPEESPALFNTGILGKFPEIPFDAHQAPAHIADPKPRPSIVSFTTDSSGVPAEPISMAFADITSVLLPTFPATISSLESIQILSATVIRRTLINPGMPDKEKSSSIRSLANMLPSNGNSNSAGPNTPKKALWITQQMVLTSFKVGGSSPSATPNLSEYPSSNISTMGTSNSRTIAHLHLFSLQGSVPGGKSSSGLGGVGLGISSSQSFGQRPRRASIISAGSGDDSEVARKPIRGESTAGVWDEPEGQRKFVMRIGFGGQDTKGDDEAEWVVEMRNAEQLHEWIRQIKSIAVVIRAEQEGHGRAIREAYNAGSMRGDDLALELDMQRRSASIRSPQSSSHPALAHEYHETSPLIERNEEDEDVRGRPTTFDRMPSAARGESPDMLSPEDAISTARPAAPANTFLTNKALPANPAVEHPSTVSPSSSRPGTASSAGTNQTSLGRSASISRNGGTMLRKKPSWSSSTSGGSSVLARKFGKTMSPPPPPPLGAPPSAPLPALPTESSAGSATSMMQSHTIPSTFGLGATVGEPSHADMPSHSIPTSPRGSLPSPDITDDELAFLRARQGGRATSLPTSDSSVGKAAAAKLKKERFMAAFKPIPLAPEVETSPKLGGVGETNSPSLSSGSILPSVAQPTSATSPLGAHVAQTAMATPTMSVPTLSRLESTTSSATGFFTPTEGSISHFDSEASPKTRSQGQEKEEMEDESGMSTPSTLHLALGDGQSQSSGTDVASINIDGEGYRPDYRRFASDAVSLNSMASSMGSSRASTNASRRRRERKVAVDVMSEFSESPDAAFQAEGEEAIQEDRPRVIRFA